MILDLVSLLLSGGLGISTSLSLEHFSHLIPLKTNLYH
jgi:hypothetical protein